MLLPRLCLVGPADSLWGFSVKFFQAVHVYVDGFFFELPVSLKQLAIGRLPDYIACRVLN